MQVSTDPHKIDELLSRGVEEVIVKEDLRSRLLSGEQLRVKLGIDPTSPNLHLGRSIPLLKLRDFQELGHHIVFIVGDATGVVGDTSDKESERPMLTRATIEENMRSYKEQVGKLLDLDAVEFRHNSEWLDPLTYKEIGEYADQFSVADFISRENIKKRLDAGKRVSLREVLYPLMQGYDSVAIKADVELGGTDQKFNVLAGRPLQEYFGQRPQNIILGPLIPGLDGRKMSSSWGNTINLTDEPNDMYGKVMSLTDELIPTYLRVCTRVPRIEVEEIEAGLSDGTLHPKEAKMQLAREIVTLYHTDVDARAAESYFTDTFSLGAIPEEVSEISAQGNLMDTLVGAGIVGSNSELRRLVSAGAITHMESNERVTDVDAPATPGTYRIGKKRFVHII